jgi:CRP-like cAMP-binding protein
MQLRTYAANETIYRQGDPPAALFFLLSGSVALYHQEQSGRQDRIHVLAPGESCGHAALLPASPQNETAVAAESARLVALMHADFISLSIEKSEIAILILQGVMEEVLEKAKMAFTAYHGLTNQLTAANIIV